MGPLGWQETIAIFVVALLLFGPKKLPQLGKDIAKAVAEFRRHTADLKGTWDREMSAMDRETGLGDTARQINRELTSATMDETYHGTSSGYDSGYDYGQGVDQSAALSASTTEGTTLDAEATTTEGQEITPSTDGATATQGAETTMAEHASPSEPAIEPAGAEGHPLQVAETVPREKRSVSAPSDGNADS